MEGPCLACGAHAADVFFERHGVLATTNVSYARREDALAAPRGSLRMAVCPQGSHIFNAAFAAERVSYDDGYENALHFSPTFDRHQQRLAESLIERFALRRKRLLEVGCGDGSFLRALCEVGDNVGVGVDRLAPVSSDDARIRFVRADEVRGIGDDVPDFVCSRHTLEHVAAPRSFLGAWRRWAGRQAPGVYLEVPNGSAPFCDDSVWDLIYEHVSYFTPRSLARLCAERHQPPPPEVGTARILPIWNDDCRSSPSASRHAWAQPAICSSRARHERCSGAPDPRASRCSMRPGVLASLPRST